MLWNDGPRLKAIDARLQRLALAPSESGKGRNVWFSLGYTLARQDSSVVAVHDCDVLTYSAENANAGLSRMNGLHVNRHAEEGAVELFASNIMRAGQLFLENPMETPFIASWNRVHAADQTIMQDMVDAVKEDASDFMPAFA